MGIFDDAIREHLDLKRRQGADESELQQLEDEAFGLPARPGDPDFPETGAVAADSQAPAPEPGSAQAEATLEAEPEAVAEPSDDAPPHGDALLTDPAAEPEAPPADEGPIEDEGAAGFTTTEREAIADQPTEFFDQAPEPLDLDELDLDLKDELDDVATIGDEPEAGEELLEDQPAVPDEPDAGAVDAPVEEIEVVEETESVSDEAESAPEPPASEEGEESEDVLEETPEFLRDNPDDDELWFEQGEPKDFDF